MQHGLSIGPTFLFQEHSEECAMTNQVERLELHQNICGEVSSKIISWEMKRQQKY
jgi:hypothetical protein